ncbi:MAG: hypothetical protein F6K32_02155 [Desertifilum sp. SIO1I2]|nr:hypothetical protein [Desertifilum sp. SIO1I2]
MGCEQERIAILEKRQGGDRVAIALQAEVAGATETQPLSFNEGTAKTGTLVASEMGWSHY